MEGQDVMSTTAQPGNVALATIIEFSIQRTYHELMILSELLPRKTDMERKIEIVQFAHRTRQLFVRLLSLVKWAKNGCKIDRCMAICNYLDQQAMLYIDTADRLSKLARGTLVQARLPAFSIPVAVDVLTSGTYPRLPTCIRDKIIPPDAISDDEQKATLKRLSQIIEYRLVTSDIPRAFKQLTVYNGRVKLLVDKEFSVTLTVMGDYPTLPWRLLGIEILVEDLDSRDGKPLVHEMQVQYLHTLVQSRLVDTDTPLHELYSVLHTFCQSLQLEVLYSQAQKIIHEQLNSTINIEKYVPCKRLVISYWRPATPMMHHSQYQQLIPAVYKMDIHVDESNAYKPLCISHAPAPVKHASSQLPHKLKSNQLSLEKILLETVHVWSYVRLGEVQQKLEQLGMATDFAISDLPPTLTFKVIKPCMDTECVRIAVDCQQGMFLVSLCHLAENSKVITDIQENLNASSGQRKAETLKQLLHDLKLWIGIERCKSSIQYIRTLYHDTLPLVQSDDHPVTKLGTSVLYVKVPLQDSLYVVVVVEVIPGEPLTLHHKFYLLPVTACTFNGDTTTTDFLKLYMKPGHLTRLDSKALVHAHNLEALMEVDDEAELMEKSRSEESCYFLSELVSVVNQCELRAEFVLLAEHLWKEGIHHQGLQDEDGGAPLKLSILKLPNLNGEADELLSILLDVTIRVDFECMNWVVEFMFSKNPITPEGTTASHQCIRRYDMRNGRNTSVVVDDLLRDWKGMVKLYNLCLAYSQTYADHSQPVGLYKFDFKSLQLAYGTARNYVVTVSWQGEKKPNGEKRDSPYELKFSMCTTTSGDCQNPHTLTAHFLELLINTSGTTLAQLMQVLCETVTPLSIIQKLPELTVFGLQHSSKAVPQPTFTVLVQSATFIRISYRQTYIIDVILCENERVLIRDGAYGLFDSQPSYAYSYTPAQSLKVFLSQYEENDQSQILQSQSIADEEHPPTPSNLTGLDSLDALLSGPVGRPSPPTSSRQDPSPKPTFQNSANSPAVAPSPLGGFGSPLDIQMTSPALPMNSPATMPAPSPSSNILAASPGLHYHPHGTPQGLDPSQANGGFPIPSPKSGWLNSPATLSSSYTLSPRAGGQHSQSANTNTSPRPEHQQLPGLRRPQRSGYTSLPTPLSHSSLAKIMTPTPGGEGLEFPSSSAVWCPLERFLGSAQLKRHLSKILSSDLRIVMVTTGIEPGTVSWTADGLQYKVFFNNTCQALKLSVTPIQQHPTILWGSDELAILERYFSVKVVSPPYKQNNLLSFCRMTATTAKLVKDFIRIIQKQMYPDPTSQWQVEWCLTLPLEASRRLERLEKLETGVGAVMVQSEKLFYVLRFTRNTMETQGEAITQFSAPFVHEWNLDTIQVADKPANNRPESSIISAINIHLQSVRQQQPSYQQQQMTSVYASCQEIMNRLVLPTGPNMGNVGM